MVVMLLVKEWRKIIMYIMDFTLQQRYDLLMSYLNNQTDANWEKINKEEGE